MEKFLDQFSKLPLQHKVLIMVGLVVLILGYEYAVNITTYQDKIQRNEDTMRQQEAELLKLQTQAQYRSQYMREVERLRQRLREAEEQLPKAAEVPKLLRDISYEAGQSGLRVDRFELKNEVKQDQFARVPVQMKVDGSYHEIAVFLDRLAKMPRIVNVTDLEMTAPKSENKKVVLTSTFNATTYRFLEPNEQAPAAAVKKK
jgi:type IV pilus assembly protein PilO